jgi:hypothetical protein
MSVVFEIFFPDDPQMFLFAPRSTLHLYSQACQELLIVKEKIFWHKYLEL